MAEYLFEWLKIFSILMTGDGQFNVTLAGGGEDGEEEEEVAPPLPPFGVPGGGRGRGAGRGVLGACRGTGRGGLGVVRGGGGLGTEHVSGVGSDEESEFGAEGGMAGMMQMMMRMNKENMKSMMEPMVEVLKSQMRGKRKREEEEEEGPKSRPILIDIPNHHLKDDAHTELDMVARSVRPYNGGDQAAYWAKRRQKAEPVIEDLKMTHLTKTPVNPSTIAQLHDRGFATSAKQWLSSNYSVRDNDRKIRAAEKGTAGAYYYDYAEAASVWDAVDAIHNYTMVLRMVHEDDWTGQLLLKTLHECRMFAHPKFGTSEQRQMIMDLFDKVRRPVWGLECWVWQGLTWSCRC